MSVITIQTSQRMGDKKISMSAIVGASRPSTNKVDHDNLKAWNDILSALTITASQF